MTHIFRTAPNYWQSNSSHTKWEEKKKKRKKDSAASRPADREGNMAVAHALGGMCTSQPAFPTDTAQRDTNPGPSEAGATSPQAPIAGMAVEALGI